MNRWPKPKDFNIWFCPKQHDEIDASSLPQETKDKANEHINDIHTICIDEFPFDDSTGFSYDVMDGLSKDMDEMKWEFMLWSRLNKRYR